jgi:hypothetical protein
MLSPCIISSNSSFVVEHHDVSSPSSSYSLSYHWAGENIAKIQRNPINIIYKIASLLSDDASHIFEVTVKMISIYRTSASSIVSSASRRFYHSTVKSFKAGTEATKSSAKTATEATAEKAKVATEAAVEASSGGIMSIPKNHPFAFSVGVATVKTSAADLVAQMVAEGKTLEEVDWKRNGIFVVFGFAYLGCFQYWLMVNKFRQWFPTMDAFGKLPFAKKLKDTAGMMDAGKMVVFDLIVHMPIIYFPTYYTVKEFVSGHSWNPVDWIQNGVGKYAKNANEDLTAMVQLWGPSNCVQAILPTHIRLPFRHIVSFFWTVYVSFTRGSIQEEEVLKD